MLQTEIFDIKVQGLFPVLDEHPEVLTKLAMLDVSLGSLQLMVSRPSQLVTVAAASA